MVTTTENEQLLVTEYRENNYFVGELKGADDAFFAERISANVVMEIGGSWELITNDKNKYTISFANTKGNQHFIPLSNNDYFVSLVEGHTISEPPSALNDAIKQIEVVKE